MTHGACTIWSTRYRAALSCSVDASLLANDQNSPFLKSLNLSADLEQKALFILCLLSPAVEWPPTTLPSAMDTYNALRECDSLPQVVINSWTDIKKEIQEYKSQTHAWICIYYDADATAVKDVSQALQGFQWIYIPYSWNDKVKEVVQRLKETRLIIKVESSEDAEEVLPWKFTSPSISIFGFT